MTSVASQSSAVRAAGPGGEARAAQLRAANINPRTGLATDYLNHFNEAIMLLEMIPDMPECAEDFLSWRPLSYCEHFMASNFKARDLAIEAYAFSPPEFRANFDRLIAEMHRIIAGALARVEAASAQGDEERVRRVIELAVAALKTMVDHASSTIHGDAQVMDQAAIDGLMDMM